MRKPPIHEAHRGKHRNRTLVPYERLGQQKAGGPGQTVVNSSAGKNPIASQNARVAA